MSGRFLLTLVVCFLSIACKAAAKPSIFIISIDSVRADRVGFIGAKEKCATTNLDRIASDSIDFQRAYAQSPVSIASDATVLTGLYPQTHRVADLGVPLLPSLPYLPDLLHAGGYRTAAFVGASTLDPWVRFAPGFNRGFDVYDAPRRDSRPEGAFSTYESHPGDVIERATTWIGQEGRTPVFLWISLYDSHADYCKRVAALDAAVGELLRFLKSRMLYDSSLIVIAADHGESLGAHGEQAHGIFLYNETIHVPLLLKLPHQASEKRQITARVSLVDIAPSVLEVAGLPIPSQMQGQSLLRAARNGFTADEPAYSRSDFPHRDFGWSTIESWRAGKYLLIRAPRPELYDLASDPAARRNLAESRRAVFDTMSAQLESFDRRLSGTSSGASSDLSSSELQKLSSLGYIGLQRSSTHGPSVVLGKDPKDEIGVANRVQSAMEMLRAGNTTQALPVLKRIVARHPKIYLAEYGLGVTLIAQREYKQAMVPLHEAITLWPDSALAHFAMGVAASRAGDWEAAATHLEIAAARIPDSRRVHDFLSQAYFHLGRKTDAARQKAMAASLP